MTATENNLRLAGKIALVTGAGRGIGQAIAQAYGRAGARVVCTARTVAEIEATAQGIVAAGGEALAIAADVTDPSQVERLFERAVHAYGGLDIVVLNAGGDQDRNRIEDGKPENWTATVALNLFGAYHCARAAIPYLKARGAGKILSMGSGMGHRGMAGHSAYCVAKAGLWMLTQTLALELNDAKISVNEIIPGPVNTALTKNIDRADPNTSVFAIPGEWVKQPADVVDLALFLATQPDYGPTAQSYSLMRRLP